MGKSGVRLLLAVSLAVSGCSGSGKLRGAADRLLASIGVGQGDGGGGGGVDTPPEVVPSPNPSPIQSPPTGGGGGGGGTLANGSLVTSLDLGRGITVTFSPAVLAGQYANDDWWVQGPVSIVAKTPASETVSTQCLNRTISGNNFITVNRALHGAMINPQIVGGLDRQGYDACLGRQYSDGTFEYYNDYQASLDVAKNISPTTPLVVAPNSSLILSKSRPNVVSLITSPGQSSILAAAVLTVVTESQANILKQQASGSRSFRPRMAGTNKAMPYTEQNLQYQILRNVLIPQGANPPSLTSTADQMRWPWPDHSMGWGARLIHPTDNMPGYGEGMAELFGDGLLWANSNLPQQQKRDLVVRMVQIGIDFFGDLYAGYRHEADGGQGSGRVSPIVFAGAMLNDSAMLNVTTTFTDAGTFGEIDQTFVVPASYVGHPGGYTEVHVGMPEWGFKHSMYPQYDRVSWSPPGNNYRVCCTGKVWGGIALGARMMSINVPLGAKTSVQAWNHQAFFDYVDRFMVPPPAVAPTSPNQFQVFQSFLAALGLTNSLGNAPREGWFPQSVPEYNPWNQYRPPTFHTVMWNTFRLQF